MPSSVGLAGMRSDSVFMRARIAAASAGRTLISPPRPRPGLPPARRCLVSGARAPPARLSFAPASPPPDRRCLVSGARAPPARLSSHRLAPRPGVLSVSSGSLLRMSSETGRLIWLAAHQRGVLSRAQVLSGAISVDGLRHRIRKGGPWQRLLPGVYLTTTGQPTGEQLQIAATLFAGAGLRHNRSGRTVHVQDQDSADSLRRRTGPSDRKRGSHDYVVIRRTSRMPDLLTCDGPLRFAPRRVRSRTRSVG